MNNRSEHISSHLRAKLGEVVEATLQVAPNRPEAYFALMSFALMSFALMSLNRPYQALNPSIIFSIKA